MIFSNGYLFDNGSASESYKERNFYFKVFAGYLFNELIPEYFTRKISFFSLLKSKYGNPEFFFLSGDEHFDKELPNIFNALIADELQVTFDYHGSQLSNWSGDHGELADIMITGKHHFLCIEAKYKTDWNFNKDITGAQVRIKQAKEKYIRKKPIQVLLVSDAKWENAKNMKNHPDSQWNILQKASGSLKIPLIVITWEDIMAMVGNEKVYNFMLNQLS